MKKVKRILSLLLVIILLSMTACTQKSDVDTTETTKATEKSSNKNDTIVAQTEPVTENKDEKIVDEINKTYETFKDGSIDYSTALSTVSALANNSTSSDVISASITITDKIESLNNSRTCYTEAKVLEEGEFYGEAIAKFQLVVEDDTNYADAQARITTCIDTVKTTATESTDKSIKNGEYKAALDIIDEALTILPDDTDLNSKKENTELLYIADTKKKVADYLKKSNGAEAVELIKEFETVMEITEDMGFMLPTSAIDLKVINKAEDCTYTSDLSDTLGNNYNGNVIYQYSKSYYTEYNIIDEGYEYLSFTVAPKGNYNKDVEGVLKVYADNKVLWVSDTVTRKTEPTEVCVAIPKNCKYIKFENSGTFDWNTVIMVIDPYVWK